MITNPSPTIEEKTSSIIKGRLTDSNFFITPAKLNRNNEEINGYLLWSPYIRFLSDVFKEKGNHVPVIVRVALAVGCAVAFYSLLIIVNSFGAWPLMIGICIGALANMFSLRFGPLAELYGRAQWFLTESEFKEKVGEDLWLEYINPNLLDLELRGYFKLDSRVAALIANSDLEQWQDCNYE